MSEPSDFSYDIRIRERMIRAGRISEADVQKYQEALADREEQTHKLELKQPALGGREEARDVLPPPFGTGSMDDLPPPPPLEEAPAFDSPTRPLGFSADDPPEGADGGDSGGDLP